MWSAETLSTVWVPHLQPSVLLGELLDGAEDAGLRHSQGIGLRFWSHGCWSATDENPATQHMLLV